MRPRFFLSEFILYFLQAINKRVMDQNSYMDKAKLRGYLATLHSPTKSTKEFAANRLQQLRGTQNDTITSNLQRYHLKLAILLKVQCIPKSLSNSLTFMQ